ncbi:AmmeMemoRadiSam system protein A [Thermoanaerobacter uzonensis]|uniref:AmmeMemoRadiSam system protein A n=1 Tax=Thermoanaerobacter uzonensis TaxID=447593 RepID=UPI003D76875C
MGVLLSCYLMPHPPIIVPEVGRGEEKKIQRTIDSLNTVSSNIKEKKPDTIIVVTPHGYVFRDAVAVTVFSSLEGDLGQFGARGVRFEFENDLELVEKIVEESRKRDIPIAEVDDELAKKYVLPKKLDHGTIVPLYFVTKHYANFRLVHISYGFLYFEQLYEFGTAIGDAIRNSNKKVVFIASGDLSHKLTPNSPNGYTPKGEVFDKKLLDLLSEMKVEEIIGMDKGLIEEAAECGFRSVCVMLGVLDGYEVKAKVLSHEGPFGVGYGVAQFEVDQYKETSLLEKLYNLKRQRIEEIRQKEDNYVKLARESLEYYVKHRKPMPVPEGLPEEMYTKRAGVFVSLHKDGELRGCIGTVVPQKKNIAEEIIKNAISAGFEDPRFDPVEEYELKNIEYSVDVLTPPQPVKSKQELNPKKYGVIVKKGYRSGLLLPDLEGVDTVEEQISIALRKAGISPDEDYTIEKFEVERHK